MPRPPMREVYAIVARSPLSKPSPVNGFATRALLPSAFPVLDQRLDHVVTDARTCLANASRLQFLPDEDARAIGNGVFVISEIAAPSTPSNRCDHRTRLVLYI